MGCLFCNTLVRSHIRCIIGAEQPNSAGRV